MIDISKLPCGLQDAYIDGLIGDAVDFYVECDCNKMYWESKGVICSDGHVVCSEKCKRIWED